MKKDKNRFDWIKNLDDKEITRLANKSHYPFSLSEKTKYKVLTMIMNSDRIASGEKESRKFTGNPLFKFALSFAVIFVIIISFLYFAKPDFIIFQAHRSKFAVSSVTGEAFRQKKGDEKKQLKTGDTISEKSNLIVSDKSSVQLTLNENAFIKINENSELITVKLYKKKEKTDTGFEVKNGIVSFTLAKLNKESEFEVETGQFVVKVVGTDFSVKVTKDGTSNIEVRDGEVHARIKLEKEIYIRLNKFKKEDAEKIRPLIDKEVSVRKGQNIELNNDEIILLSQLLIKIIDGISPEAPSDEINGKFNIEMKSFDELREKVLVEKSGNVIEKTTEADSIDRKKAEELKINDLKFNLGVNLTGKDTSVTSDGSFIYITSDSNKKIFCIDFKNSRQKWTFFDPDINKFTCAPVRYQERLILSTPFFIYVIDNNGKTEIKKPVEKGTTYWAGMFELNNKLYIPAAGTIYTYSDKSVAALSNFQDAMGQIYASGYKDFLYCSVPNEKKIKIYDLKASRIIWESEQLNQRTFMSPIIYNDEAVIIDANGLVYKFNYLDNSKKTIQLDTGVVSQPILYRDDIYFIGNNGFFYRVSLKIFSGYEKIIKVDIKPDFNIYLTKRIIMHKDNIYVPCDNGFLIKYNMIKKSCEQFIVNSSYLPLIGSAAAVDDSVYIVDSKSNFYQAALNQVL